MSDGWRLAILLIGLLGWSIYIGVRFDLDERLAAWWVAQARKRGGATWLFSFAVSAAGLLAYSLLLGVGLGITAYLGQVAWAAFFVLPQTLVYTPFVLITMPSRFGYGSWRRDLATAGASVGQQRQIAWCAGPPSLVGFIVMCATAFGLLLD